MHAGTHGYIMNRGEGAPLQLLGEAVGRPRKLQRCARENCSPSAPEPSPSLTNCSPPLPQNRLG